MAQLTIFDTPLLASLGHDLSRLLMRLAGWRLEGQLPDLPKAVVIAAPHTSYWDFPVMLAMTFAYRAKVRWMGKASAFRWPLGGLMRWLGGIPIDRSRSHNVVARAIKAFQETDQLLLVVPPEGSRGKVHYWKTGFYYIASGAQVPIMLAYADFGRKAAGLGPTLWTTGDIDADMRQIQGFYAGIQGKHADRWDEEAVVTRDAASK